MLRFLAATVENQRDAWASAALVVSVALGAAGCTGDRSADAPSAPHIASIVDGDTIIVEFPTGRSESVRLLGLDAPESVDPNRPVQCYGAEAAARLAELLPDGTPVAVVVDREPRDRYGRLLAYVVRLDDDAFVNAVLLAEGYADLSIYEPNSTLAPELRRAHEAARTAHLGLWSACGGPDVPLDPPPPSG